MLTNLFDAVPIHLFFFGIALYIYCAFEIGFQIGKRTRTPYGDDAPSAMGPMVGGVLAMLGFVLAFTFSMVASHHDRRKINVLEDANAIGTAYLRTDLIGSPEKETIKQLLREYVDNRLQPRDDREKVKKMTQKAAEQQRLIWEEVLSAAKNAANKHMSLYVRSINHMFDVNEKRITSAIRNRIPESIWLTLYAISAFTMITIGVQAGITQWRRLVVLIPLILAFAALTTVIEDLDRPLSGIIKVGQESMIELQRNMGEWVK